MLLNAATQQPVLDDDIDLDSDEYGIITSIFDGDTATVVVANKIATAVAAAIVKMDRRRPATLILPVSDSFFSPIWSFPSHVIFD
eukprot:15363624-Ditylum_brightwellii.AAC.1